MLFSIIATAAGLITGYFIPTMADVLCRIKCEKKQRELEPDTRFCKPMPRALFALGNGACWFLLSELGSSAPASVAAMLAAALSLIVAVIDARIRLIPNEAILAFLVLGVALQLFLGGIKALLISLLCLIGAMALFLLVAKRLGFWKVGAGDVKYAGAMGLLLGYPCVLSGMLFMAVSMSLYCLGGILLKKLSRASFLAMAPFMSAGVVAGLIHLIVFAAWLPDLGLL